MDSESNKYENLEGMLQDGISEPLNLPLQYLRSITNNFSDERLLGEGGFGMVYKGVLPNGETVAVKKLNSSMPGIKDRHFDNEAKHLMKLKHPNVVLLVGWCSETENIYTQYYGKYICAEKSERLLCLEYMPNGNLRKYLSDEASGLGWDIRYRIIKGICHGLHYLHVEWQHNAPIIHMDLKPANILLDNNMVPKIADFGLSRLFSKTKTWTQTISRDGTLDYMAPEYINKGLISTKSDIFSLGVIIIEIVTGHRDYPDGTGISSEEFIELVVKNWRNRLRNSHCYTTQEIDCQQIRECIEIGLVCVTLDRSKRPTTRQIIKMLHGRLNFTDWKEIQTSSLLPVQQTHNLNGGLNPLYENPILKLMQPQSQQSPQQGYGQNTGNSGFLQSQLQQKKQEEPPPQQQHTQQVLQQQSHQEMQQHLPSSCYDISNVASSMSRSGSASQLQSSLLPGSSVYQQSIFEGNDGGPGLLLHHSLHNFSSQEASNLLNLSLGSQLMASEGWPSKRLAVESLSSLELQSMQQPKLKKVNHQSNVSHISGTLPPLSSRDGSGGTNDQGHGSAVRWEFRVRLRIEGIPVHAWTEAVAALVIGSQCAIHYVEGKTRRRERTRTYDLWAWCVNPSNIAKEVWLTVTDPDREVDGRRPEVEVHYVEPSGFKYGITYKLFIHLEVVEDLSFIQGPGGGPNRKRRRFFDWHYGVPDSLGERRERARGRQQDRGTTPRRRDDDDDDDDHYRSTRRHRSSHAWERVSRCRGTVEDCYSTSHYRGHQSSGVYPHRSRPSHAGWGSEAWDSGLHRLTNTTKFVYKPKKRSSIKRVSFAYPLSQMMGHPTKEARILEMLSDAGGERGGWHASPVASPFAAQENPMEAEEVPEEGEIQREEEAGEAVEEAPFAARSPSPSNTQVVQQHFQQPVTKMTMDALTVLVEQGNKAVSKKKSKVAPMPAGDAGTQMA